jgi:hypothetical protein
MIEYNPVSKCYEEKCPCCPPNDNNGFPTGYCSYCHDEGRIQVSLERDDRWWVNFLKWIVR